MFAPMMASQDPLKSQTQSWVHVHFSLGADPNSRQIPKGFHDQKG